MDKETISAIKFYVEQIGGTGIKGDKGDPGIQGPQGPAGPAMFHFYVSGGHLYVEYAAESSVQPFSVDANGHLIYSIQ